MSKRVSKRQKASHTAKLRGGTPVANTRSEKTTNVTSSKSKETVTERQREKTHWNTEKDDENVENISHKVENLQRREDKNHKNKSHLDIISIVVASIAVSIALYPHLFPNPISEPEKAVKVGPGDIHTQQQFINGLSERLSVVESRLSDIKQCRCRTDDTPNIDENLEFENRVIKSESDLSGEVNANKEELKDLKDEVQKLKDQIDVKFGDIKNVQEEHKALQAEVINLYEKLGDRLQFVEQRNAEVSQQMFKHNETLRDLNLHVENIGSTLKTLTEYVKSQVITSLSDMLGNITANNMETEILKDKVQKINEGLQINVTTLERMLGEQSQTADKKNIEMMQLMLQQNETLNGLVLTVVNHGRSLNSLVVTVENHASSLHSLDVSVKNHGSSLHILDVSVKHHGSSLHSLDVSVTNHGTNLHNLNVSVEILQTNVTTLERKIEEQSQSAEKKTIEMMQIMLQHNETLNGLVASVENHGSNLHNLNVSVENLGSNLNIINVSLEGHDSTLRSLNVSVKTLDRSLLSLKDFADSLDSSLRSLNVSVENHRCNISDLNVSVDNLRSNVKNITENITGISIETLVLDKRTEHIADNIFDKGSLIVVIMINTTLLVLVIIYLVASRNPKRHLSGIIVDSQPQQSPAPYSTAGRILSQVRANLSLERKLCVISFYEETHPLHMRMTQSVTQQLNQGLEEFIIRRHEDILECPPVSLYFLFVDFNERNVILEDPTLGLGDLRLTTVQAVQKMGGKIVIFYVRDLNSRHLNPMKLYNEDLASVTKQRELSALSRLCRFISAYDQLTDNQKAHLSQIVLHELCSR